MPCSDNYPLRYDEHDDICHERQKVAKLILFVRSHLAVWTPPAWIEKYAKDPFHTPEQTASQLVPILCQMLGNLTEENKNKIIYNGRDKTSRELADWWENHQEEDRLRLEEEKKEEQRKKIRQSALSKLTKEEKKALGL